MAGYPEAEALLLDEGRRALDAAEAGKLRVFGVRNPCPGPFLVGILFARAGRAVRALADASKTVVIRKAADYTENSDGFVGSWVERQPTGSWRLTIREEGGRLIYGHEVLADG